MGTAEHRMRHSSISSATQRLRSGTFGSLDINPPGALDRWVNGPSSGGSGGSIIPGEISVQGKGSSSNTDMIYSGSGELPIVINLPSIANGGFNFSCVDSKNTNGFNNQGETSKRLLNSVNYAKT